MRKLIIYALLLVSSLAAKAQLTQVTAEERNVNGLDCIVVSWPSGIQYSSVLFNGVAYADGFSKYTIWAGATSLCCECRILNFSKGDTVNITIRDFNSYPITYSYVDRYSMTYTLQNDCLTPIDTKPGKGKGKGRK